MNRTIPGDWADKAVCAQVGGDLFYPELEDPINAAKAICRSCESRLPCLEYSIRIADWNGIYGGFTERVRRRIACDHAAGRPLEDIIAEDDEAFYAQVERSAELARAAAVRHRAAERARYRAVRASLREGAAA